MRALLVGVFGKDQSKEFSKGSIKELKGLVQAVGGKALGYVLQKRDQPDQRYYVGEGKAKQLKEIARGTKADTIVFDDFLTPAQIANLEKLTGVRVLDRTDLVLEIFSRRAKTKEAKLQVELARLMHELPRLHGRGKALSRLGGGLGTRGPGEQEAEIRKRLIKKRIHRIRKELEEVKKRRREQRKRRERSERGEKILRVAIVGYTNAGKSTLMNALTKKGTFTADMLFATLDTKTSARVVYPDTKLLFTDTVGFIRKLPPELIESFKATLEEVQEADIILHVVDVSDEGWLDYINTVNEILKELSAHEKPVIYALNKADRLVESEEEMKHLPHPAFVEGDAVLISAEKRWGLDELLKKIVSKGEGITREAQRA
ncbi:MAG: GTPase HflX [Aquificae bacterium]|nr:GTPase HflX [Aquificota bacterium]